VGGEKVVPFERRGTTMVAERDSELLQDRVLAERARRGDRKAFDVLYRRHAPTAWRLALAVARRPVAAEAAVGTAFATTLAGRSNPDAATGTTRSRLLVATRHAAMATPGDAPASPPAPASLDLDPTAGSAAVVRQAFDGLPERLRSILWLVDAEGCPLPIAERVLELAPGSVESLADRARLGLQERVLHVESHRPTVAACRRTIDSLVGYARSTLAARDATRVRKHLDGCAACRGRLAALDDLVPALRSAALPLPAAVTDDVVRQWSAAVVRESGPLHLVLPGGQPMPAWAQRTVAGAAAGIIALGIAGATILVGGRGGRSDGSAVPSATAGPGAGDGESALGGLGDLVLDGIGFVPPSSDPASNVLGAPAEVARSSASLPRTTGPTTTPESGSTTAPSSPTTTAPPPAPAPTVPPPAPPAPEPADEVTVAVGDVGTVTVGDQCIGVELLGTVIGCEATTTDDAGIVSTEGTILPPLTLGL
jgi:DNA-directed RNA polymerase specialized sigma24 family protein